MCIILTLKYEYIYLIVIKCNILLDFTRFYYDYIYLNIIDNKFLSIKHKKIKTFNLILLIIRL